MSGDDMATDANPLSWRDVYRAVGETRRDVLAAIDAAVSPLVKTGEDHEVRLRELEKNGSAEAREALRIATAIGVKHDALALIVGNNEANRRGMLSTLSAGQRVVIMLGSIIGAVIVVLDFLSRISA